MENRRFMESLDRQLKTSFWTPWQLALIALTLLAITHPLLASPPPSMTVSERLLNQLAIQQENIKNNPRNIEGPLKVTKLSANLYLFEGHGANSGLVVGDDALLLIDSKEIRNAASEQLLKAVRQISNKPIRYVINTHSHFDHAGGNAYFAQLGATIIAQENYRYTPIAHHLRFDKQFSMTLGDEEIIAYHTPTHTLDSTIIYLPKSNVLFMGDNFSSSWLLYEGAHGMAGYQETHDKALSLVDNKTLIVPGHGTVGKRPDLLRSTQAKEAFSQQIGKLHKQGKPVKEMAIDKPLQRILSDYEGIEPNDTPVHLRSIQDVLDGNFMTAENLPDALLASYTGHYEMGEQQVIEVVLDNGQLVAREDGQFIARLQPITATRFDMVGFPYTQGEQIEFIKNDAGKVDRLAMAVPNRFVMNYWLKAGERVRK